MMKAALLALFVAAVAAAGCGGGDSSPATTTTAPSGNSIETFSGILVPGGSAFYSFSVSTAGTANLTLASLTSSSTPAASTTVVGLGLGNPVGTGCSLLTTMNVTPALTAQLTSPVAVDVYCVQIQDVGHLTAPLDFTIRISHP
jgi:hypothetical protein